MPCAEELVKQRDQLCLKKEVTEQGICITGVRPINLQQLCDAVASTWTKEEELREF